METEMFTVTATEWRIVWETEPGDLGERNFRVRVYTSEGNLQTVVTDIIGGGQDVTYSRGPGDFYLTVKTDQPYAVAVEQMQ